MTTKSKATSDDVRAWAATHIVAVRAAAGMLAPDTDLPQMADALTNYKLESHLTRHAAGDRAALTCARRRDRQEYERLLTQLVGDGADAADRSELSYAALRTIVATPREAACELLGVPWDGPVTDECAELARDVDRCAVVTLPALLRGALAPTCCETMEAAGQALEMLAGPHELLTGVPMDDLPLALAATRHGGPSSVIVPLWAGRNFLSDDVTLNRRRRWIDTLIVVLTAQLEQAAGRLDCSLDEYLDEVTDAGAVRCVCLDEA